MPTYGEKQKPAGVNKSPMQKPLGKRTMKDYYASYTNELCFERAIGHFLAQKPGKAINWENKDKNVIISTLEDEQNKQRNKS